MPRKPRRAKLTIETTVVPVQSEGKIAANVIRWLRLTHRNGEIALAGEDVANPTRARAAIIRAMVDVVTEDGAGLQLVVSRLREMGYTVAPPRLCADCGKQFDEPSAFEDEDICPKCASEMAAEEAGR